MNSQFKAIYMKELKDAVRDRRAMMALLYFVVGAPLFMLLVFYLISLSDDDRQTRVLIDGAETAPGLVAFIERNGIEVENIELDVDLPDGLPEGADGILIIPDDYSDKLAKGQPIALRLFFDEGSKDDIERGQTILAAVRGFGSHVIGTRLISRGVPLVLMQPLQVEMINVSEDSFFTRFMSEFMLLIVIFAPFSAGMSVAIDVLAGERERNSLQPLLSLPVSATTLALGKWATVATFGIGGTIATSLILFAELRFMPQELVAFDVNTDPLTLTLVVLQLVPLAMFAGALQMFLSILAKSFREAQTLLSMVMMIPFVAVYIKVIADDKLPEFVKYLPILADMESASSLIFKGQISLTHFGIALAVSMVGIVTALVLTIRRLESERLLDSN